MICLGVDMSKQCTRCKQTKQLREFAIKSSTRDGLQYWCRACTSDYARNHRPSVTYVGEIGGKLCRRCGEWRPIDEFYSAPRSRDGHYSRCASCCRPYYREYYHNNKEHVRAVRNAWVTSDGGREKVNSISREWMRRNYHEDENFKMAHLIRTRLSNAYKKYINTGEHRVSRSGDINFAAIFEAMGPCPGEYGRGAGKYTIDHKVPLRTLELNTELGWKIATHPDNHQWLSWNDNYDKMQDCDMDAYNTIIEKIKEE